MAITDKKRGVPTIQSRVSALRYSEGLESIRAVGTNGRTVLMIRVKVEYRIERENPRYIVVICCCNDRLFSRVVVYGHTV